MSTIVFDIECDDLLAGCTRMWILAAYEIETNTKKRWLIGDDGWKDYLSHAKVLIGHNILGYDLPVLKKLFGWTPNRKTKIRDTLLMSQILNYKRFGMLGHSLKVWGEALSFPKQEFSDWTRLSPTMIEYCEQDVAVSVKVYEHLMDEFMSLRERAPNIDVYLKAEHAAAKWCAIAELEGWHIDIDSAREVFSALEAQMQLAYDALNSRLGTKTVAKDMVKGEVDVKVPKWTKQGFYDVHTARWFDVDPCSGFEGEERKIEGPYCRVEFVPLNLDSVADVKIFLYRNNWQPTEWNFKENPLTGKKERSSPKITEDSLEFLGGDGKLYVDFLTARSRYGILKTWLENTDKNRRLHGGCMLIGTPSMRARHNIIVNVPSAEAPWGKEMRALFTVPEGWTMIGCDSSGNQARGLAHYLGNEKFTDLLLNGDIHQYNADVLTSVLKDMGIDYTVKRAQAKRILYAFLFGASGGKLWSYIFGTIETKKGKQLKDGFLKAVPGFKALLDKLENIYEQTSAMGEGYIPSIAGNRIYVDSPHKLLVYLLQSCEKATCSAALMLTMERLEDLNIPYQPLIYYHDEIDFMVPTQYAEIARDIGKQAFKDGPALFGITIMDGDGKMGKTWYDVH